MTERDFVSLRETLGQQECVLTFGGVAVRATVSLIEGVNKLAVGGELQKDTIKAVVPVSDLLKCKIARPRNTIGKTVVFEDVFYRVSDCEHGFRSQTVSLTLLEK